MYKGPEEYVCQGLWTQGGKRHKGVEGGEESWHKALRFPKDKIRI